MRLNIAALACILFSTAAVAGTPSAEQLLSAAKTKAGAEHKAIFVHFGASWCGWCKKLDAFLDRDDIKPVFEKYFVPLKLVVQENEKNKSLENAGADELCKEWGGPGGLPYCAFLSAKGKLIVNSKHNGQNIGFPAQPDEIDWFVRMMKQAAPNLTEGDLKTIETVLRTAQKS